mgnify:CR=1 FL=1
MIEKLQLRKNFIRQLIFLAAFTGGFLSVPGYSAELKETVDTKTEQEVYLFKKHRINYIEISKQRVKDAETRYRVEGNKLKLFQIPLYGSS